MYKRQNLAYEAATADLNDVNMIDPYHLEAYGVTTVNYNRDVDIFPVLNAIFEMCIRDSPHPAHPQRIFASASFISYSEKKKNGMPNLPAYQSIYKAALS